jgi:hypothetical protein
MLDFAILGLLMEGPRHGYELKHALGELGFWKVSFGSLYPALRRLEKRGAIGAIGEQVAGRPTRSQIRAARPSTHFSRRTPTPPRPTERSRSGSPSWATSLLSDG